MPLLGSGLGCESCKTTGVSLTEGLSGRPDRRTAGVNLFFTLAALQTGMTREADPVPDIPPESGGGRPDPAPAWANASNRNKIVVGVDDLPQHLRLLRQCILSGGFTFVGVPSGVECLTLVSRIEPRLVLLDVQMPDLDGFETCRRLRADMRLSHVPIAFLTSRNSPDDVKRGLACGGNDFILKPVSLARLMERVNHWTSRRLSTDQILGVARDKSAPRPKGCRTPPERSIVS